MSQITFLDRMVAWAAPEAGVLCALARRSFEALSAKTHGYARGYDGAAKGRATSGWKTAGTSADAEIAAASGLLRDRMRDLTRNNPHTAKAVSVLVNNIVGSGIFPRAATGDTRLDETRAARKPRAALDAAGALRGSGGVRLQRAAPLSVAQISSAVSMSRLRAPRAAVRGPRKTRWRSAAASVGTVWPPPSTR